MITEFVLRYFHVLAGIVWIGMLYYFNFVQTEYFKEAEAAAKADAMQKLAPRALKWFRYGALVTFLTGLGLLHFAGAMSSIVGSSLIWMGALTGTLMFLNVWLIIWPKQKIVLGMVEGDKAAAAAKAGLASRTNTLFSGPMLLGMLGSKHLYIEDLTATGLAAACALIVLLELNAIFGRMGPMASVIGVVHLAIILAGVIWALLAFL